MPLSRWSSAELAREAVTRGIVERISDVTVWRWLSQDAIKPWQHRSWIFPRDPRFADRAGPLLCDPATLLVAWERVKRNRGSQTAGVDGQTPLARRAARRRDDPG